MPRARSACLSGLCALLLLGCPAGKDEPRPSAEASGAKAPIKDLLGTPPAAPRWYSPAQVQRGESVYLKHCQACHLPAGKGAPDWRQRLPDGHWPPPPLDDSAHAWHHPLPDLLEIIDFGGHRASGGRMPAFAKLLTPAEKQAVIAYIQSLWPAPVYDRWHAHVNGGQAGFDAAGKPISGRR